MSENEDIFLSVVVPSYNETTELKKAGIEAIDEYLKKQKYSYEVLVVDDKSTNGTLVDVREYIKGRRGFRLLENEHGGKAITVMTGLLESKGKIAIFTDMDQATPIDQAVKLLDKFEEDYDVVIGSRSGRKGAPLARKVTAWGFRMLRGVILGLPFNDTQCGFKGFSRRAINEIFPGMLKEWRGMRAKGAAVNAGFDVEILFIARKRGLKIAEVEVEWRHVQNEKQVQLVRDAIEAIKDMIRVRVKSLSGRYN